VFAYEFKARVVVLVAAQLLVLESPLAQLPVVAVAMLSHLLVTLLGCPLLKLSL
jgi:hypothetical protein